MGAMKQRHLVYSTKKVTRQRDQQLQQQQDPPPPTVTPPTVSASRPPRTQRSPSPATRATRSPSPAPRSQRTPTHRLLEPLDPLDPHAPPHSGEPRDSVHGEGGSSASGRTPALPSSTSEGSGSRSRLPPHGHHRSSRRSARLGERSVRHLHPSPALLQSERATVAQCIRTMIEKKTEATLLVNGNGLLTGILTDRDIAHKVVAKGLNPKTTRVSEVMTPNPLCVASNASAIDALKKMVTGQFRHMPVADNDKVVGIIDIAKCLYEAIAKIEQECKESSKNLSEAIKKLEKQISSGENLFDKLREKLFLPTLSEILIERSPVPTLGPAGTAFDAACLMLAKKTSAVLICNDQGDMTGIFTSKDLLRRVLALDLEPATCVLSTVMTPNPFSARLNTTILETLHSMHNGRFMHVPVIDEDGKLVGLVDVLQATCAMVQQIATLQVPKNASVQPLWNHIRESFIQNREGSEDTRADADDDDERGGHQLEDFDDGTDRSTSDISSSGRDLAWSGQTERPSFEDNPVGLDTESPEQPVQEKTPDVFVYKLADWNGANHRFTSSAESLTELVKDVQNRLGDHTIRNVYYVDDDGDHVLLFTDEDLKDAVNRARTWGNKYIRLVVLHRIPRSNVLPTSRHQNDVVLGIVYYAAAAAAIAGASFFLSRRR